MTSETNNKLVATLLILDAVMLIVVAVLSFVVWKKSGEVAILAEQAAALNQKQESMSGLKAVSTDGQKIINALFIDDKTKASLIDQLEQMGEKAGVAYSLNNAEDQGGLNYDVTVRGGFAGIYQFISLVENLPYQVSLAAVALEKSPNSKLTDGAWSANLTINIANLNTSIK